MKPQSLFLPFKLFDASNFRDFLGLSSSHCPSSYSFLLPCADTCSTQLSLLWADTTHSICFLSSMRQLTFLLSSFGQLSRDYMYIFVLFNSNFRIFCRLNRIKCECLWPSLTKNPDMGYFNVKYKQNILLPSYYL